MLDFAASLVKSAAWPLTVIIGLLLFRSELRKLIGRVSELSLTKNGLAGKFDRELRNVGEDVREAEIESAAVLPPARREVLGRAEQLSENTAKIAVAWTEVEGIVRQRLIRAGHDVRTMGVTDLLEMAVHCQLITQVQLRSLVGLNVMRNLAVYGGADEVSDSQTTQFLALADATKVVLQMTEPKEN